MNAPGPSADAALTLFIGRERDLQLASAAIAESRLVTVVGAGGIGKTRFARRVMRDVADRFDEPPVFLDLTWVRDGRSVAAAVLASLGGQVSREDEIGVAISMVADRKLLVVVDNCEHVVEEAATTVLRLLVACSRLHVLAASRTPLSVAGERLVRLGPLPLPMDDEGTLTSDLSNSSVQLFVDRARFAIHDFQLTVENRASVVAICRASGGMPLAIELAAARLRTLPVDRLAARVAADLTVLAGGPRTAPERHRTMRAAIASSVDSLAPPQRLLFRRLGVFAGGWTLEAAEGVCSDAEVSEHDALDLLEQLVDVSLVVSASEDGRFRFLEPIREYAGEELAASGEEDRFRGRHCAWFADLAAMAAPHLNARAAGYWLDVLGAEEGNIWAALSWAATHSDQLDAGLRMAGDLLWFWDQAGLTAEAFRVTGRLLGAPFDSGARARMAALVTHSYAADAMGKIPAAERAAGEAYDTAVELNDPLWMARAQIMRAFALGDTEDFERAREPAEEALARAGDSGALLEAALATIWLVVLDPGSPSARQLAESALAMAGQLGGPAITARANLGLGELLRVQGDLDGAEAAYDRARERARSVNYRTLEVWGLMNLALTRVQRGDLRGGRPLLCEGIEKALRISEMRTFQACILGASCVEATDGDAARAARWLACADAGEPYRIQPPEYAIRDAAYDAARRRLGGRFDSAFQSGRGADLTEVAREVLSVLSASARRSEGAQDALSERLSARESEIIRLVAAGVPNREIAERLVLSRRTVETHVANAYAKIGVQNRVEATRWAIEAGVANG